MEVRRITNLKEVASIINIDDERLDENIPCTKAEWVNFLQAFIEYPEKLGVFGTVEGEKVKKYIVGLSGVLPPIAFGVWIAYQNYYKETEDSFKAFALLEEWAREIGANVLNIQTYYPHVNSRYGFEVDKAVAMKKEL